MLLVHVLGSGCGGGAATPPSGHADAGDGRLHPGVDAAPHPARDAARETDSLNTEDAAHLDGAPGDSADAAAPGVTAGPLLSISAPGADQPFTYLDSVPIGWGHMDPMVVTIGSDVYTPMFFPSNLTTTKPMYELELVKNGVAFGPSLALATDFIPAGCSGSEAYQPPMLFASATKVLALYWVAVTGCSTDSLVNFVALDTAASSPAWTLVSNTFEPAGETYNYLGAAMGPDGMIHVAGWDSTGNSLRLTTYDASGNATVDTVASFGTSGLFEPLYAHVAVDASNTIYVFPVISNFAVCPATGVAYTNYKDVALYKGVVGGPFTAVFSDAPADVVAAPDTNGDPCQPYSSRYPLDLMVDDTTSHVYAAVRAQDLLADIGPVSTSYKQTVKLYDEAGQLVVSDLAVPLSPVVPSGQNLASVTITKLGASFVVFGSSSDDAMHKNIAVTTTTDFVTFTAPLSIPTPYGAGEAIKVWQPGKNGSVETPGTAYFWFSGNLDTPENVNRFLDFELGTVTLP